MQFIMPLAQIDLEVINRLNTSRITELGAEILRAPASAVYTEEEARAIAMEKQRQEQQLMQADMALNQAEVANKQASAMESIAKAQKESAA